MKKIKTSCEEIFKEYEQAVAENSKRNIYDNVKRNENFYIGNQWEGVNAPNLPKPTLNILKRVVSYFVAMLVSDDISVKIEEQGEDEQSELLNVVSQECMQIIERNKIKAQNRQLLREAAVCGDACIYAWFDPFVKTNNLTDGEIKAEILQNTDVLFGNPFVSDIQKQPYILICYKKSRDNFEKLEVDTDEEYITCIRKLYKKDGVVWVTEVCKNMVITPPRLLGYSGYPMVWFSWEKVKNTYHGQSPMTPVIQNQIDINRLFAMCIKQIKDGAFPKIVYSKTLMPDGWDNTVGKAIGVVGDVDRAVMRSTGVSEMGSQVLAMISLLINYTKETMGASDAALGNVAPQNTSAIIALQKSSAMPLELQRLDFYQCIEDYVRVFIDMMAVHYGKRQIVVKNQNGEIVRQVFDFDTLEKLRLKIKVDVGAAAYWSELAGISTLDNLFAKGVITDVKTYINSLPAGTLPNKEGILRSIEENKKDVLANAAKEKGGIIDEMPKM